jgi:hypothetical protein
MQLAQNTFVALPKPLLGVVGLAFLLLISPKLLESPVPHLVVLGLALLAAMVRPLHHLGLSLIGVPALVALVLTPGNHADKSWAAALVMFEFYALEHLLWGLADELPQPWWMLVGLWLFFPSALGLLGIGLLVLFSHQRWQAGLSFIQHSQRQTQGTGWALVAMGGVVVVALSGLLPNPSLPQLGDAGLPQLALARDTASTPVSPLERLGLRPPDPMLRFTGAPQFEQFGVVAMLMIAYLVYVWRRLLHQRSARPEQIKNANGMLFLGLLFLTVFMVFNVILGISSQSQKSPMVLSGDWFVWLGLLLFLGLFVWWRIAKKRAATQPTPLEPSDTSLSGLRRIPPEDAVRAAYYRWLVWLQDLEIRRSPTQTPSEFLQMVTTQHPDLRLHSQTLTHAYERVRYGNIPTQTELERVLGALEQWRSEVQKRLPEHVSLLTMADESKNLYTGSR